MLNCDLMGVNFAVLYVFIHKSVVLFKDFYILTT
jgi:hypothetical protein